MSDVLDPAVDEVVLDVAGLTVHGPDGAALVSNVSLTVRRGHSLGLVGESGSGKSLTLRSVLGVLPTGLRARSDRLDRPARTALVFQEPLAAMSPTMRVGQLVEEAIRAADPDASRRDRGRRCSELLLEVGIRAPEEVRRRYPHELSGGMRQRVMIAAALATEPELLLCDEPTTALDVTVQAQVLDLIRRLQADRHMAVVFVSHDLAVVASLCQEIAVMKDGAVVEQAPTSQLLATPVLPYSQQLLAAARVRLHGRADPGLGETEADPTPGLVVSDLVVRFPRPGHRRVEVTAVDAVSFTVRRGQAIGLVGESGSGKSTIARCIVGLAEPSAGSILLDGRPHDCRTPSGARRIQMVFQDPGSSLNPRRTVGSVLTEVLRVHGCPREAVEERLHQLMSTVRLPIELLDRRPRALSGGQQQRVSIARALAVRPDVVILDEAIAALDVSVQASIMQLLAELRRDLGLTLLFISHDLGAVRALCSEVLVLQHGILVERGPTDVVLDRPAHPYTRQLLAAEPALP